jgi:hypothetical protein
MDCLTQKLELNTIIPAVRKEFIGILEKKSLKDSEIAKKLGITKAAVSQYKSGKRGKKLDFPKEIESIIKKSAESIAKGKNANSEIAKIITEIKKCRYICKVCKCKPGNCR